MSRFTVFKSSLAFVSVLAAPVTAAPVKPGDLIAPDNASLVSDLVSSGNFMLVKQGIRMNIVPTERIEWPPLYAKPPRNIPPKSASRRQEFVIGGCIPAANTFDSIRVGYLNRRCRIDGHAPPRQRGIAATVVEIADVSLSRGLALLLTSNAALALRRIGLDTTVVERVTTLERILQTDASETPSAQHDLRPSNDRYAPNFGITRDALISAISSGIRTQVRYLTTIASL
jgi:hypothetical protein